LIEGNGKSMTQSGAKVRWILLASGMLAMCAGVIWTVRYALAEESQAVSPVAVTSAASSLKSPLKKFAVTIRKPAGPPRIDLGMTDVMGEPVTAACSICHATRPANEANRRPADLDEFHQNLAFAHGKVSCLSCHNPKDYDTLRLADGRSVEYAEVMTLCGQCHGPQTRDYEHGAHGGMNGYWDLSRGPRTRNNCVDCHDPHAPSFPAMMPTFKPRDRFLEGINHPKESSHE